MKNEFIFTEVIDRLKKALQIKADYELAERLNMKATSFNSRKKANSLPYEEILLLANSENLNIDWLLTGNGQMLKSDATENAVVPIRAKQFAEIFQFLNAKQQEEIFAVIEEKKRINALENVVGNMQRQLERMAQAA